MERRLKCGVCAAAALALVLCFGIDENRAMQTARNAQTTLVIDAGHGGFDGGAVGADGTAEAWDINLSIAKRVQVLANFFGVPAAMTRPDEKCTRL